MWEVVICSVPVFEIEGCTVSAEGDRALSGTTAGRTWVWNRVSWWESSADHLLETDICKKLEERPRTVFRLEGQRADVEVFVGYKEPLAAG